MARGGPGRPLDAELDTGWQLWPDLRAMGCGSGCCPVMRPWTASCPPRRMQRVHEASGVGTRRGRSSSCPGRIVGMCGAELVIAHRLPSPTGRDVRRLQKQASNRWAKSGLRRPLQTRPFAGLPACGPHGGRAPEEGIRHLRPATSRAQSLATTPADQTGSWSRSDSFLMMRVQRAASGLHPGSLQRQVANPPLNNSRRHGLAMVRMRSAQ